MATKVGVSEETVTLTLGQLNNLLTGVSAIQYASSAVKSAKAHPCHFTAEQLEVHQGNLDRATRNTVLAARGAGLSIDPRPTSVHFNLGLIKEK